MSKHTPGPWQKDGIVIVGADGAEVCLMGEPAQYAGDNGTMIPNAETNALLIAAAPDMLEALRPFAEVDYEELIGAPDDMPIEEALRKAGQPTVGDLRRAMDAVDKAEGRS